MRYDRSGQNHEKTVIGQILELFRDVFSFVVLVVLFGKILVILGKFFHDFVSICHISTHIHINQVGNELVEEVSQLHSKYLLCRASAECFCEYFNRDTEYFNNLSLAKKYQLHHGRLSEITGTQLDNF